jgi:hypothetical protein
MTTALTTHGVPSLKRRSVMNFLVPLRSIEPGVKIPAMK